MGPCPIWLDGNRSGRFWVSSGEVVELEGAVDDERDVNKVEAILVNIFGGIVNCAIIANGITKACRELELKVPLVVRLEGTNVHEAQRILNESGLPITSANDLEDAAKKAVASVAKK
ncbi:succinyl- ligase [Limosa lapponica baueri]|uniref:Succinyl-ligase n=1 Tax=Limosa lapponica baueri TaxID=1758121 RepID=A0A2I0TMT4_LIMLA|nr:succinyl- ligase [Limosa lapponica baueri]